MSDATGVPGATRVTDQYTGRHLTDGRGRHLWNRPEPVRYVDHFRSEAHRRLCEAGEIPRALAVTPVAIHRGVPVSELRFARAQRRRAQKRRS